LYYWIDQICIDQNNIAERNSQIRLMTNIYGRATQVSAWLGETILQDAELAATNHLTQPDMFVTKKYAISSALRDLEARVDGLHYICSRPYWTRMWIVQELMLGRDVEVRCGHVTFKLEDLQGVFEHLRQMAQRNLKEMRPFVVALDQTPAGKVIWAKDTLQSLIRGQADITLYTLFT
jgi:hypothetical protein